MFFRNTKVKINLLDDLRCKIVMSLLTIISVTMDIPLWLWLQSHFTLVISTISFTVMSITKLMTVTFVIAYEEWYSWLLWSANDVRDDLDVVKDYAVSYFYLWCPWCPWWLWRLRCPSSFSLTSIIPILVWFWWRWRDVMLMIGAIELFFFRANISKICTTGNFAKLCLIRFRWNLGHHPIGFSH